MGNKVFESRVDEAKELQKIFGCYRSGCDDCPVLLDICSDSRYKPQNLRNGELAAADAVRSCDFASPVYPVGELEKVRKHARKSVAKGLKSMDSVAYNKLQSKGQVIIRGFTITPEDLAL